MALTLEAEQRLDAVGLVDFYRRDEETWLEVVRDTLEFVQRRFPDGSAIRRDDVAKALVPIIEVNEDFQAFRDEEKLRPKYWNTYFADLLIDRTWDDLTGD